LSLRKVYEKFKKILERSRDKSIVRADSIPIWGKLGQPAPFSFELAIKLYRENGQISAPINQTVDMMVGPGFHTTAKTQRAKKVIDDFCEEVDMDGILRVTARYAAITGNAWIHKIFDEKGLLVDLEVVDPLTMENSIRLKKVEGHANLFYNEVEEYVQVINGVVVNRWQPEEIAHYKWIEVPGRPYGMGMIEPIVRTIQILVDSEKYVKEALKKYSWLMVAWMLENADEQTWRNVKKMLKELEPGESPIIATKGETKVKCEPISINPRARFAFWFNYLQNVTGMGLECPATLLFRGEVRVSDASATAMLEAFKMKIRMKQRALKRLIEREIFKPIIDYYGYREVPKLNFMPMQLPEIRMRDLVEIMKTSTERELNGLPPYLTVEEVRRMLGDRGYEILEETRRKMEEPQ